MTRLTATRRFLTGLLIPGGVLLAAAGALQHEEVVRTAAAPYAPYFCFGTLAAAALLSWYYDQSRLLCITLAVLLTVSGLVQWPDWPHANVEAKLAALYLLPLNFILFGSWRERGVTTLDGGLKVGIVVLQAFGVAWIAGGEAPGVGALLHWGEAGAWPALTRRLQIWHAVAAVTLLTLVFIRGTRCEQGLFWALAAVILGLHQLAQPEVLFLYAGTAGLVLVFAVLDHGYDIAYRDELTGLPGRRAFNSIMGHLGGTYAIAMCDVDDFKRFNDTYGHDAGDQVLRMVATKLSHVGGGGRAFRYGGEEFLVVFRGRSARQAEPFVESVRDAVSQAGFVLRGSDRPVRKPRPSTEGSRKHSTTVSVTVSIGVAERSRRHSTPELVLDAADAAVYSAKDAGKNCVKIEETTPASPAPSRAP